MTALQSMPFFLWAQKESRAGKTALSCLLRIKNSGVQSSRLLTVTQCTVAMLRDKIQEASYHGIVGNPRRVKTSRMLHAIEYNYMSYIKS